jgi:hypothetical protein
VLAQLLIVEIPILIAFAFSWWATAGGKLTYFVGIDAVGYFLWWAARRYNQSLSSIQQRH